MNNNDAYQTIATVATAEYRQKGSRFLAIAYPITTPEAVKPIIEQLKSEHFKARHWCYAWRLGLDKTKNYRANDDGEPSGTAGRPILGQIDSFNITNVLIVVVRYFGGIKLGTSGLITAYKEASKMALQDADIITELVQNRYKIIFGYLQLDEVMRVLKNSSAKIVEQNFDNTCQIIFQVRSGEAAPLIAALCKLSSGIAIDALP